MYWCTRCLKVMIFNKTIKSSKCKYYLKKGGKLAAFFAESIQGVGGAVQFPKDFLKRTAELVRASGGLVVSDEVQTGFGRTGSNYWGFENHGIVPDIVTMAKGIGNG